MLLTGDKRAWPGGSAEQHAAIGDQEKRQLLSSQPLRLPITVPTNALPIKSWNVPRICPPPSALNWKNSSQMFAMLQ